MPPRGLPAILTRFQRVRRRFKVGRRGAAPPSWWSSSTHAGLRDRALIGLMVYSFAPIGAALGMSVEDVYT
jgi:hypothetical protein